MVRTIGTTSHRLRSGSLCALLTLLGASTMSARAQGVMPGHWEFTFTNSGTGVGSSWLPGATADTWNSGYLTATSGYGAPFSLPPFMTFTNKLQAKGHVKAVWKSVARYPGMQTTPPPAFLTILYTPFAHWKVNSNDPAKDVQLSDGGADDGFNDSQTTSVVTGLTNQYIGESAGPHLKTYGSSSGTVEDDISQSTHLSVYAPGGGAGVLEINVGTAVDDRNVVVTSTQDTTYSRGYDVNNNLTRIANMPDNNGVIKGDMKSPTPAYGLSYDPTIAVAYHATVFGKWNDNTAYHWFDSLSGDSGSGSFNAGGTPQNFNTTYTRKTAPPGSTAHAFISVIDGKDSARATGNEYYKMHSAYENWNQKNDEKHPFDFATNPMEWKRVCAQVNPGATPMVYTIAIGITDSITESGTIGVTLPKIGEGADAFSANASITIGRTCTYSATYTFQYSCDPYSDEEWWAGKIYDVLTGTCSVWDNTGYVNDMPWTGVKGISDGWKIIKVVLATFPPPPPPKP